MSGTVGRADRANAMEDLRHVGRSEVRIDGLDKVTGAAVFVDDLDFGPDLLYAAVVESPHAHARIVSIDTGPAARLPGVKAILTSNDVPHVLHAGQPEPRAGSLVRDQYILDYTVRYDAAGQQIVNIGQFAYVPNNTTAPAIVPPHQGIQITMPQSISRNRGGSRGIGGAGQTDCSP